MPAILLTANAKQHLQHRLSEAQKQLANVNSPVIGGRNWSTVVLKRALDEAEYPIKEITSILANAEIWTREEPFLLNSEYFKKQCFKILKGKVAIYKNGFYNVTDNNSDVECANLIKAKYNQMRESSKIVKSSLQTIKRIKIPERVRHEVWRRDQGKCVKCGSVRNLEFDHIIPVSKGGSNTARNIELLCEDCNRAKSAKI